MQQLLRTFLARLLTREKREHLKMMTLLVLRAGGLVVCTGVALIFGAVPFAIGAGVQFCMKRRAPGFLVGLLAAATVLAIWWMTGWVQIRFGSNAPPWLSVAVAMYLGSVFAAIGAHVVRFFVHRQFLPKA